MISNNKKTIEELAQDKERKIMETVAWRAGYYRANPQRFVSEYLGISLKLFQKILIYAMMHYYYFTFIASRGLGKTWLTALFCCVRCILYPQTKIVVTSGTLSQAAEVLLKIKEDLMVRSPMLASEIREVKIGQNTNEIYFKNDSWIKAATSTDNARGKRANIIICDEFRMIDKYILDTVIKKFLADPRSPKYMSLPEYKDNPKYKERNHQIYMSSAYYKDSWAYDKVQSDTVDFLKDSKKTFICGLPYEVAIKEGLRMREEVLDEMSSKDFDEIAWQMEMECIWLGDTGNSLFKYETFNKCRRINKAYYPPAYYNEKNKLPEKLLGEVRIGSVDVALMRSTKKKKNDAAAFSINSCLRSGTTYHSNFVYLETFEGLTTDELGIIIMRYFELYDLDYIVLDTNGLGIGCYDFICKDQYDSDTGITYKAMTCINSEDMAVRCKVKDAREVVYSVKADAKFNNDICVALRNGIENGKISFLKTEQECETYLSDPDKGYRGFDKLSPTQKSELQNAYLQTTLTEYELIKLQHEFKNGNIKVKESTGMRKDRYSSVAYSFWCATQLELQLKPEVNNDKLSKKFTMRRGVFRNRQL